MTREEAKQMFRDDKDSYGKPRAIMSKIDKIFDDFEEPKGINLVKLSAKIDKVLEESTPEELTAFIEKRRGIVKSYKIVARNIRTRRQEKKWVYTSLKDYKNFGFKIIESYCYNYEMESYELVGDKWELRNTEPKRTR